MWSRLQKNPISIGFENTDSTLLSTQHYITNVKLHITDHLAKEPLMISPKLIEGDRASAGPAVCYFFLAYAR
jgi:hypothetical protein